MATDYGGGVAAYVTVLFLILFGVNYHLDSKRRPVSAETTFKITSQSWKALSSRSETANYVLLTTRIISFLWFVSVSFSARLRYYDVVKNRGGEYFKWFTHWNIMILVIYFGIVTLLSMIHVSDVSVQEMHYEQGVLSCYEKFIADKLQSISPLHRTKLSKVARAIGNVCCINAPMVTLIIFGFLNPEMEFWNITAHLVQTGIIFTDYTLSADVVHAEGYKWNVLFIYTYSCFVWIFRAAGIISYPYFFLDTGAFGEFAFVIYTGLLILNGIFFFVVYVLFRVVKTKYLVPPDLHGELLQVHGNDEDTDSIDGEYDVVVVGLGAHGSAIASNLASRGYKVLGIEQCPDFRKVTQSSGSRMSGNPAGSSHGGSRVIRTAYFEDSRYVPLVQRALALWKSLNQDYMEHGGTRATHGEVKGERGRGGLLAMTGGLMIGKKGDGAGLGIISGTLQAAKEHNLAVEELTAEQVKARYTFVAPNGSQATPDEGSSRDKSNSIPVFNLQPDEVAIYETEAGVLAPEKCVEWLQFRAENPSIPIGQVQQRSLPASAPKPVPAKLIFDTMVTGYIVRKGKRRGHAAAADAAAISSGTSSTPHCSHPHSKQRNESEMDGGDLELGPMLVGEATKEEEEEDDDDDEEEGCVVVETMKASTRFSNSRIKTSSGHNDNDKGNRNDGWGVPAKRKARYKARQLVLAAGSYLPALIDRNYGDKEDSTAATAASTSSSSSSGSSSRMGKELQFLRDLQVVRRTAFWFEPRGESTSTSTGAERGGLAHIPLYLWDLPDKSAFYGFPSGIDGRPGAKVSFHCYPEIEHLHGIQEEKAQYKDDYLVTLQHYDHVRPEEISREVGVRETQRMRHYLKDRLLPLFPPGGRGNDNDNDNDGCVSRGKIDSDDGYPRCVGSSVCQYTNTPSEHFLLDFLSVEEEASSSPSQRISQHPPSSLSSQQKRRVLVCSCCSGHGFKFTTVIGEVAADMLEGKYSKSSDTTEENLLDISLFSFESHLREGRE